MSIEEKAKQIVNDHILHAADYLIGELISKESVNVDDHTGLFRTEPDMGEALLQNNAKIIDGELFVNDESVYILDDPNSEWRVWENLESELQIEQDDYRRDIFEYWIIDDYFGRVLSEHGETVTFDVFGLTIWARCTTGQAIKMDSVIEQIAKEWLG